MYACANPKGLHILGRLELELGVCKFVILVPTEAKQP